jgi:MerR family copper efflux transcriptional regulator
MFEEAMSDRMRIGDLAERAQVTPRTIRYYESVGLIPPGEREGTGQHYYPEETVTRLRKIDQLKQLGLSLDEIRDVIDLYFTDPSGVRPKQKVLVILRAHLAEVDQKVAGLQQFRADLAAHIERFERWLEHTKSR